MPQPKPGRLPFDDLGPESDTCQVCGRALSNPQSRKAGIGPVCAGHKPRSTMPTTPMPNADTLPPAKLEAIVRYENLHVGFAHCRARLYWIGNTALIVLTDQSDHHNGTSVTNRAERAAYLAWMALGQPRNAVFAEHYTGTHYSPEHVDLIKIGLDADLFPQTNHQPLPGGKKGFGLRVNGWQHLAQVEGQRDLSGLVDRVRTMLDR